MLSYYAIYFERLRKNIQQTEKEALVGTIIHKTASTFDLNHNFRKLVKSILKC